MLLFSIVDGLVEVTLYLEFNLSIDTVSQSHNLAVSTTNEEYMTEANSVVGYNFVWHCSTLALVSRM